MGIHIEYVGLEVMGRIKSNDGKEEDVQPFFEIRILTSSLAKVDKPHISL
jgi:hypothetical protein